MLRNPLLCFYFFHHPVHDSADLCRKNTSQTVSAEIACRSQKHLLLKPVCLHTYIFISHRNRRTTLKLVNVQIKSPSSRFLQRAQQLKGVTHESHFAMLGVEVNTIDLAHTCIYLSSSLTGDSYLTDMAAAKAVTYNPDGQSDDCWTSLSNTHLHFFDTSRDKRL